MGRWARQRTKELKGEKFDRMLAIKSGEVSICVQEVVGLWVVIGEDGYYVQAGEGSKGSIRAWEKARDVILSLTRLDDDKAEAAIKRERAIAANPQPDFEY